MPSKKGPKVLTDARYIAPCNKLFQFFRDSSESHRNIRAFASSTIYIHIYAIEPIEQIRKDVLFWLAKNYRTRTN